MPLPADKSPVVYNVEEHISSVLNLIDEFNRQDKTELLNTHPTGGNQPFEIKFADGKKRVIEIAFGKDGKITPNTKSLVEATFRNEFERWDFDRNGQISASELKIIGYAPSGMKAEIDSAVEIGTRYGIEPAKLLTYAESAQKALRDGVITEAEDAAIRFARDVIDADLATKLGITPESEAEKSVVRYTIDERLQQLKDAIDNANAEVEQNSFFKIQGNTVLSLRDNTGDVEKLDAATDIEGKITPETKDKLLAAQQKKLTALDFNGDGKITKAETDVVSDLSPAEIKDRMKAFYDGLVENGESPAKLANAKEIFDRIALDGVITQAEKDSVATLLDTLGSQIPPLSGFAKPSSENKSR